MAKDRVVLKATLSNPPNSPRRERFETSLMGAMGCDGGARSKRASTLTLL
ncbi:hypothetical protein KVC29_05705 [Helicobacter pylori]|nr:hypothetical protein [Helicobacter sp. 219-2]MDI9251202.1 hypothetical protein [Helicobacter sp. 219-2]WRB73381.1 hypothetical protein KVD23_05700 [Helicobacter pylori]WRB80390.1 hypothetical protein KVC29_05705 [Helicobacter pylori]WRD67942.1 hypothetical protein E5E81_06885 [Helicobacter pylori]